MKRFTMVLALALMVAMPMMAERVTPETARKVAATFLNNNGTKATQLTDLSKEAGFQNLYIFTTEQGFVIIAADDCVRPILGYSLTDKFVVSNMPENMREWLQGYSDEIQFAIEHKMASSIKVKQQWTDLRECKPGVAKATSVVEALIQTTWDQYPRYNNMCPYDSQVGARTITGCVATAMAQILKFWGTNPTPGIGSHSYIHETYGLQSADFGNTIYNWGNMPLSLSASSTTEQINEVAKLMYHCGVSVDMNYGLNYEYGGDGSAAYSVDIPAALINYFNFDTTVKYVEKYTYNDTEEWKTLLKNELIAGRPMEYHGSSSGGHSFICDGYNSDDYFHFNWGWSGSHNDFYTLDDLTPGSHNYNNNQGAVIGIQPATIGQAAAPVLGVVAVQEPGVRNAQLTWNEVENATAYWIYRNNNLIDSISSGSVTSYTDVLIPYGTSTYYIRSIDENGDLSWPSNYASLTLTFSAPTNLEAEQTEDGIALSWLAGENAVSHNVYCNNILIESNINTTTYTDNRIIAGTLSYFVKGVDTFGDESEASETAEITIPYSTPLVDNLFVSLSGDNATLSWTAPQWCYPSEPSATLTYGSQVSGGACMSWGADTPFWGQRHLAERMSDYDGKKLYKVSFSINYPETYELYIYKGSTTLSNDVIIPTTLIASQTIIVTDLGWNTIDLSEPIVIDGTQDLWIFMHNPNSIENFKTYVCPASNTYLYHSSNPSTNMGTYPDYAYLIKAFITDGTYTYNLYDNGTLLNGESPIADTSYTVENIADNTIHQYTVTTNYNGGEPTPSNKASLTIGTHTLNNLDLGINDRMTITEGSTLAVSGDLVSENPEHLIIENGAQLINGSDGVKATVKKTIQPYTEDKRDGWNLIASPIIESITPSQSNGLLANTYDLYLFDQSEEKEWRNYRANSFNTIGHKMGYLYANSGETTLSFVGTLASTAESTELTFDGNAYFAGFNLIGNPYPCNTYIENPFYVPEYNNVSDSTKFVLGDNDSPIPPCEAVLVQAQAEGESVTFSKTAPPSSSKIAVRLNQADQKGATEIDQVRIMFQQQSQLAKYPQEDSYSTIYIPQNGKKLAVANAEGLTELPLNLKTTKNGTYMLNFETVDFDTDYLHLIDNLTGNDVDLLVTPSYTFEAKTSDYASRFRLVFSNCEGAVDDNETFAYVSNGEIVINQEGTLQIVDLTGRMVVSRSGRIECVPTTGMTSGVYVLRLINGDNVKTQKIVIE